MMGPKCETCGATLAETPLYRENPVGQVPAIWRCQAHVSRQPDPDVKELVDVIHGGGDE